MAIKKAFFLNYVTKPKLMVKSLVSTTKKTINWEKEETRKDFKSLPLNPLTNFMVQDLIVDLQHAYSKIPYNTSTCHQPLLSNELSKSSFIPNQMS